MSSSSPEKFTKSKADILKEVKIFFFIDFARRLTSVIDNLIIHISFYFIIFYMLPKKTQTDYTKYLRPTQKNESGF